MFPKALASGTDIVCVELEDGIARKNKEAVRKSALALFEQPQANDGVERIVRINCLREAFGLADVLAILATETPPPALMLPKVRTPEEVAWLDDLLTYLDLGNPDGMAEEARKAKAAGFSGKGSIHPKHIAALNEVFTPTADEIDLAWRVTKTFEEADTGLVVIDGKLIEKPVLRDMYRILSIAERISS